MSAARKRRAKKSGGTNPARRKAEAPDGPDPELIALLERIDACGDAGMPVGAPSGSTVDALGKVKKNGDLYTTDQKRLDALDLWSAVDRFGERTIDGVSTSLCTLNETGRRLLARARESAAAAREQELLESMRSVEGVREVIASHAATLAGLREGISRLQSALDEVQADGKRIADVFEEVHRPLDPAAIAPVRPKEPIEPVEPVAVPSPDESAFAGFAEPVPISDTESLASQVLARIPADYWMEIPQLFERLRADGIPVLPGQLNDLLLALSEAGRIAFNIWMRTLTEIPTPEHGILQPDARVLYYVQRA